MLFQTPTFGLFLILVVVGATLFDRRATLHQLFLLAASYVFYAAWDWRFLGLILFSTVLDYSVGLGIQRSLSQRARKALLTASIVGNLGVLGLFKYHDFFAGNLNALFARFGVELSIPILHLILPVGISFYTFQTLSYTIDIYRGDLEARTSFLKVALFVAFFPQLVAGPIVRARQFLPQLDRRPEYDPEAGGTGLYLILKGLIKKVIFADIIGSFLVNPVWAQPANYGWAWILLAAWGFRLQIYGDFSGYSDIAIGCGRLLGFELPQNFNSPYKAHSNTNYWRRWHMTLGSWFRDYLFFPLGGSRLGELRTNVNLMLTMLLVGLWHGAAWTFVLWGGIHGTYLVVERIFRARLEPRAVAPRWLLAVKIFVVFQLGTIATVAFRAPGTEALGQFVTGLARPTQGLAGVPLGVWVVFALAILTHYAPDSLKDGCRTTFARMPAALQAAALVGTLWLLRLVGTAVEPFYYFQF
jgi:D-alanyl-lipoteichoic acid acyltransferase DltB (MBOAT superfamily)